jgi:hypothetical protein
MTISRVTLLLQQRAEKYTLENSVCKVKKDKETIGRFIEEFTSIEEFNEHLLNIRLRNAFISLKFTLPAGS